jgi:hypothetical protein
MSSFHAPSPGTESTPATTARRRRPSLACRKAELYQRLRDEDAQGVADDLLTQAKAGDLPAIQLLLLYIFGPPSDWNECEAVEEEAETCRVRESEPAPADANETVPPAVPKRIFSPAPLASVPSGDAESQEAGRPQSIRRDPVRPPSVSQPRKFGTGRPSPNGCLPRMVFPGASRSTAAMAAREGRTRTVQRDPPPTRRVIHPPDLVGGTPTANGSLVGVRPVALVARSPPAADPGMAWAGMPSVRKRQFIGTACRNHGDWLGCRSKMG